MINTMTLILDEDRKVGPFYDPCTIPEPGDRIDLCEWNPYGPTEFAGRVLERRFRLHFNPGHMTGPAQNEMHVEVLLLKEQT